MVIKQAEYVISSVEQSNMPVHEGVEFMFCGRSNVGKSSFINLLTNRHHLAKTSQNPGKTQTLNFFIINNEFYFVDVPGYGFANVSKSIREGFGKMIESYCKTRSQLKMAFLLVDFRHKPSEDDVLMYNFLKYYNIPVTVIATKADKLKNSERAKCKKAIVETLNLAEGDRLIPTSALKREGIGEVYSVLDKVLEENKDIGVVNNEEMTA